MKIKTIDMRTARTEGVTEFDLLKKVLKKDKKYSKNLLYRGFDGDNIPALLEGRQESNRGLELYDEFDNLIPEESDKIDEDILLAYTENEILGEVTSDSNIFAHASSFFHPAIAVFDSKCLKREDKDAYSYIFKNPNKKLEALVAVYRLKYS